MPALYLIDGYAQFFRAYHAIRTPMTSPVTGEPTNMTFGFVGMLLKLLRGEGSHVAGDGAATHLAVALDVSGDRGTFRSELYPEYKANRSAPPEDLAPQVERCLSLLEAIGVPSIGSEGFEADDVIATIAAALSEGGTRVRIVSKDKDLKQLLAADRVEMYDIHTDELITEATLMEDTGVSPGQMVDMLTLMGDTADNVPGVDKVGAKTAAQLIAEFGTIEAILDEVRAERPKGEQRIKGKRRENILAAAESLPLGRELITLRADAPVTFELERSTVASLDLAAMMPILRELGFNRYQDELKALIGGGSTSASSSPAVGSGGRSNPAAEAPPAGSLFQSSLFGESAPTAVADGTYHCVTTKEDLDTLAARMAQASRIAIDTETTATRPMLAELVGVSVAIEPGEAWYVPVRAPEGEATLDREVVLDALRPALEAESPVKVGHNIKYDAIVLRNAGVELGGVSAQGGDTMVASYLIDASRSSHSMDALSLALLGRQNIPIKELIGTGKSQRTFDTVPLAQAAPYAAEDADVTLRLAEQMLPQLSAMGLTDLYRDVELPLVGVLAELERNGIAVDRDELGRQRERLEGEIARLKEEIDDAAMGSLDRTFDIDSPKQLSAALFGKPDADPPGLGIKPVKKTKTGYSTDAEVLQKLTDDAAIETPIPRLVLEYRQLAKLVSTYLVALDADIHPRTGRIHASFNQTVAATGRLSSSDPNLQNIPIRTDLGREIRRAFVAPQGRTLITADYSQIELRLLAHLSEDPNLMEAFERGEDIHRAVAAQIHGVPLDEVSREQRSGAKMVNFGIVYGITAFGLARRLGIGNGEADEIITGYKKKFAGITTFLEECVAQATRHGYVETILKRRRPIPDIDARNPSRRSLAERMAINSVVQGSAADLIKVAMVNLHRLMAGGGMPGSLMLLQIHDELVFEADEKAAEEHRAIIVREMEGAMSLRVPVVVDSGVSRNWYDAK